jgi:SAM-dependent methyltransferase
LKPGDTVVDLAAGTGKLTRLLVDRGLRVIAVEPVAEMRAVLAQGVDAEVLDGTAEAIPVDDGVARAVTVAQAFHWFDPDRAEPEIARVLEPDGLLAIVANVRDQDDPLLTALNELISPYRGTYPNPAWPDRPHRLFDTELRTFGHDHVVDEETFVERVASISWIGALPDDVRERVLAETRALVADLEPPIRLPYVTQVFLCRQRGRQN